jgi:hypothetical protein
LDQVLLPGSVCNCALEQTRNLVRDRNPLNDLNGVWFDRLTMHGLFSAHPELVEGLNGLNVLNVQSFADMPKKAQWRKNLAAAR